jgi:hypothetical protein
MMVTERTQRCWGRAAAHVARWLVLASLIGLGPASFGSHALWCAPTAFAQAIPSNLRAAILLRALEYEKVFASNKDPAMLLVLSGSGGAHDGAEMTAALRQLAQAGAGSRKVVVDEVKGESTTADLMKRAPAVLYVAEGNEAALGALDAIPRAIVLCGNPSAVGKGCMLSVEPFGTSSRLVVDTAAATKKGLTFDARMLRVARVIR